MAKGQTQSGRADTAQNYARDLYGNATNYMWPVIGGLSSQSATAQGKQWNLLQNATGGYQSQQSTGGYDPTMLNTIRTNASNLASTGGYDPSQVSDLQKRMQAATGSSSTLAATGGYDPLVLSKTLAGYSNLADTGGFNPQQAQNYINQATSGVRGTYDVLSQQARRAQSATGGLGTGGDVAQMARQLSQEQARSTLAAQTSLNQEQIKNTLAGLGGLQAVNAGQAGAKIAAQSGVTAGLGQEAGLLSDVAGGRRTGFGQQAGVESNVAAGVGAANVGLGSLYNTATGQITALGNQILSALGLTFGSQAEAVNALTQLTKSPDALNTFGRILGLGGQIANLVP